MNKNESKYLSQFEQQHRSINLSSKFRWFVYLLFLTSNILISLDHGSIPASTQELRQYTSKDQIIGLFGSLVYVGNLFGSMLFFSLINKINRKVLLIISLTGTALCLFTFVLYANIAFMFFNRIFVGVFQAYITIYLPVWTNQFGNVPQRSLMIAFVQLASPIGIFIGYLTANISIQYNFMGGWMFAFIFQAILIALLTIVFLFIPKIYFDKDLHCHTDIEGNDIFLKEQTRISEFTQFGNYSLCDVFSLLMQKKIFLFSILGYASLCYVITGTQYWISDYMLNILNITSAKKRLFCFTIVCFTSPTLGVLIGGFLSDYLGGYEKKESSMLCFILGISASIFAFVIPLMSNLIYIIVYLWLVLFFGGGIVPPLTGIIITSVPKELAASGNSITNFIANLFGYLPAPYVYGVLSDIFKDKGQIGMTFTLWYSFIGLLFFGLGMHYRLAAEDPKERIIHNNIEATEELLHLN